jgi:[ribosomal protein S5]-alanine N-acetyltransferase
MRERYHYVAMANPPAEQGVMPITMRDANSTAGKAPAAPAQPLVDLPGPRIRLRPFRNDEVETAWQGLAQQDEAAHPRRRPEDRRPQPSEQFRRRLHRSGRLWRGCLDLAIDRDGRLVGTIQARTRPRQTLPAGVYEIGVILYQPRDRRKGYGAEAVELLTTWLFDTGKAERVQASTDAGNTAMRAVLERLGFQLEGILRGYGKISDGTRRDGALYAVLRPEWGDHNHCPAVGDKPPRTGASGA